MKLNQAILRLMLLEGEDYQEVLDKVRGCLEEKDKKELIQFLKSRVIKCAKNITNASDLERFIKDVGG